MSSGDQSVLPPGRRLVVPLQINVLQGLSFVKARLLSMEIPANVGENLSTPVSVDSTEGIIGSENKMEKLMKIDPFRGSWGLRFLELELFNPTDVVFEISVSVRLENSNKDGLSSDQDATEYGYPKTRIDRDYSARVLIPLEHFKLPILDGSFFVKDLKSDGSTGGRNSSFSEKNTKAELDASIKNLISRIKVRWQSGRNSSGELNIKDAIQAALQTSVMDVLLPDPLTFGFRLVRKDSEKAKKLGLPKDSVLAHDMTPMETIVRNNTMEVIKISLSVTCRDVAGENCIEGSKGTVLWSGKVLIIKSPKMINFLFMILKLFSVSMMKTLGWKLHIWLRNLLIISGVLDEIAMEVLPLQESRHCFSLYFLVPGEYTLVAAAVIDDANNILRARAKTDSPDEPIFCRGPPFHVRVTGTV